MINDESWLAYVLVMLFLKSGCECLGMLHLSPSWVLKEGELNCSSAEPLSLSLQGKLCWPVRLGHLTILLQHTQTKDFTLKQHRALRNQVTCICNKIFTARQFQEHNSTSASEVDGIAQEIKMLTYVSDKSLFKQLCTSLVSKQS